MSTQTDWDNEPAYELKDIGGKTKYYFSKLTNREKHAYNNILSQVDELPLKIEIPELDSESLTTVLRLCFLTIPFAPAWQKLQYNNCREPLIFQNGLFLTAQELEKQKQEILKAATKLLRYSENMSDFEKELYIHDK